MCMVNETEVYTTRKIQNTKETEASEKSKIQEPHDLYAQSAVLMDAKSGRILFEKMEDKNVRWQAQQRL